MSKLNDMITRAEEKANNWKGDKKRYFEDMLFGSEIFENTSDLINNHLEVARALLQEMAAIIGDEVYYKGNREIAQKVLENLKEYHEKLFED